MSNAMEDAGVKQAIAAEVRKAHFAKMAREAMADAGMETREQEAPEQREAEEIPVMQVHEPSPKPEGRAIDVNAPVEDHMAFARSAKPEFDKPMPKDASFADLLGVPASQRGLSLGKYIRGRVTGNWNGADQERAMSGATTGAGGGLIPTVYSSQIVDLARPLCQVLNGGAQIVPLSNRTVIMPTWTQDPVPAFRAENAAVAQTDGAVGQITFNAKSLAGYTAISRELLEDTDLADVLTNAYAKAVAQAWDLAALSGNGTAPNPLGVFNNTNITDKSALGTNGVAFTYDHLIDAVGGVLGRNEQVTAALMAPRSYQSLGKLKDSQGRYLNKPDYLANVRLLQTGQIPVNQVCGTANNASSLLVGDLSQLFIGVRTSFGVDVYEQPLAVSNAQVLLLAWQRLDVQIGRPTAFAVRTGLLP